MSASQLRNCALGLYVLEWLSAYEDLLSGPVLVCGSSDKITLSQLDGWHKEFDSQVVLCR